MMNNLETLEKLIKEDRCDNFDQILHSITKSCSSEIIVDLYSLLNDDYLYQDLLWNILHFTESFPIQEYSKFMVISLPKLISKAPFWAETLIYRNLNNLEYFNKMLDNVNSLDKNSQNLFFEFALKITSGNDDVTDQRKVLYARQ